MARKRKIWKIGSTPKTNRGQVRRHFFGDGRKTRVKKSLFG